MAEQRVVLITGASAGIGRAIAERLAQAGCTVFGTSRDPQRAEVIPGVTMLPLDVRTDASVATCVEAVLARARRLDVLINNAGYILIGAVEETSVTEAHEQFETNCFGVMRLVKAVLPIMRRQGGGQIINISGPAGIVSIPFMGLFSASKAALEGYTLALRHEVKQFNIRVSLVLPGPIRTQVLQNSVHAAQRLDVYTPWQEPMEAMWRSGYDLADDPALVAARVWHILNRRSPKLHYTVGKGANVFILMRRLLPEALFEQVVRRIFSLDTDPSSLKSKPTHNPRDVKPSETSHVR